MKYSLYNIETSITKLTKVVIHDSATIRTLTNLLCLESVSDSDNRWWEARVQFWASILSPRDSTGSQRSNSVLLYLLYFKWSLVLFVSLRHVVSGVDWSDIYFTRALVSEVRMSSFRCLRQTYQASFCWYCLNIPRNCSTSFTNLVEVHIPWQLK